MNNVEKIKERLNIVDVVESCVKLEKAGSNLKACCPFHKEKTPSFFVSPERGTYKCFGCGEGGDIFSFVEKFEGVDFRGALKILADKAGIKLTAENPKITDAKNKLYDILKQATVFFEGNLRNNKLALEYLKKRGLTEKTIRRFRLGFAKDEWQGLYNFLKKENYTDAEIEKAGLIKKSEQGKNFYDRFRNRIIFPLFDNSNQPLAFSGRFFGKDNQADKQAKYLNSPATPLFNKSNVLYGYNFAKNQIRKRNFSIVVEGQMDLLICHQFGYDNTVASSGTALSVGHINLLKRLSNRAVIAFDGDEAGFASAGRASKIALAEGMEVRLLKIPAGLDPADFILRDKRDWQKSLKNAKHIIDFYLNKLILDIPDRRKLGKKAQEKILPFVAALKSEIEKANFVKEIANKLALPEKAIWAELDKIQASDDITDAQSMSDEELSPKTNRNKLRHISGLYWWQKKSKRPIMDLRKFEKEILKIIGTDIFEKIKNLSEKIKNDIIWEAETFYKNVEQNKVVDKIEEDLKNLEIELLEKKMETIMAEQKKEEERGNAQKALQKFELYNELSKKKNRLTI
ncbi:MAG: DNA primase [Candidatus Pacebacteria bacterium]|nr:DNA primase [Candidatus Paceibacterota bacterium]